MRWIAFALSLLLICVMFAQSQDADRVAKARPRAEPLLRERFKSAGVVYPAAEVFFRVFKREAQVELWARNKAGAKFQLVHTYEVMRSSGVPGPKRREGDSQVPEGFYQVDRFNPKSMFHLSMGLNYPNASDKILSDPKTPGFDIFIHGSTFSIGCVPLGDEGIEELYIATQDSRKRPVQVHLFPARMNAADWPAWRTEQVKANPALGPFWDQLQKGYDLFESTKLPPTVRVEKDGSYVCSAGK